MKLYVDPVQRKAKMRAHTATHLLHYHLDHLLGGTKQAGSLVDDDQVRFDFAAKQPLTSQQLHDIETALNKRILADQPVSIEEMPLTDAKALWAKAFFEDKYGERVRVVQVATPNNSLFPGKSIELCGGTHVTSTGQIGAFKITNQEAVASGIRRIEAITGPRVARYAQDQEKQLEQIAGLLDSQPKQIEEKIQKLLSEYHSLSDKYTAMQVQTIIQALSTYPRSQSTLFSYQVDLTAVGLDMLPLKTIVQTVKQLRTAENRLLGTQAWQFALYAGNTNNAKELQSQLGLKGGGDDQLIQGKDPDLRTKIA